MWESPPSDTLQLHASRSCDQGIYVSETDTDMLQVHGIERCPQVAPLRSSRSADT